jgi:hypothetical protein
MNCDNVGFVEGVEMQLSRPIYLMNDAMNVWFVQYLHEEALALCYTENWC